MEDKELDMVNNSLRALRDHFEKKGEVFILAWCHITDDKMSDNILTTTCGVSDYGRAIIYWSARLAEWMDEVNKS